MCHFFQKGLSAKGVKGPIFLESAKALRKKIVCPHQLCGTRFMARRAGKARKKRAGEEEGVEGMKKSNQIDLMKLAL